MQAHILNNDKNFSGFQQDQNHNLQALSDQTLCQSARLVLGSLSVTDNGGRVFGRWKLGV